MKKIFLLTTLISLILPCIFCCSSGSKNANETGSIAVNLIFPPGFNGGGTINTKAQAKPGMISEPLGDQTCPQCDTMVFTVTGDGMDPMYFSFSYDSHDALLSGIPPGNGRTLTVDVKDSSSEVILHGSKSNIPISVGAIISVDLTLLGTLSSPNWVQYGNSASGEGISNGSNYAEYPSLALDSAGYPYVAWDDNTAGCCEIYIKRWDGSEWVEVGAGSASYGGISNNSGISVLTSLALDPSGNPVVAWHDNSSGKSQVYIKRFNPAGVGTWDEIGAGSASGGGISNTPGVSGEASLAIYSSSNLVVAWCSDTNSDLSCDAIYIKRWDGNAWVEIGAGSASGGGISNTGGISEWPSLALDSSGNPVVAWDDSSNGNYEIYVKHWDSINGAWIGYGGSDSGGGISDNLSGSGIPSLALDSLDNPVVAWYDVTTSNSEIFIKRWNGSAWVEIGNSSANLGGISDNSGESRDPSLALDSSDNPVVAWSDNSGGGNPEIYIKRWTGSEWMDYGGKAARDGGISMNSGNSQAPRIALDPSGYPVVTWYDDTIGPKYYKIYALHWAP